MPAIDRVDFTKSVTAIDNGTLAKAGRSGYESDPIGSYSTVLEDLDHVPGQKYITAEIYTELLRASRHPFAFGAKAALSYIMSVERAPDWIVDAREIEDMPTGIGAGEISVGSLATELRSRGFGGTVRLITEDKNAVSNAPLNDVNYVVTAQEMLNGLLINGQISGDDYYQAVHDMARLDGTRNEFSVSDTGYEQSEFSYSNPVTHDRIPEGQQILLKDPNTGIVVALGTFEWHGTTTIQYLGGPAIAYSSKIPVGVFQGQLVIDGVPIPGFRGIQCFSAGTLVLGADGSATPIESLKAGCGVLAFDYSLPASRCPLVPAPITRVIRGTTKEWIELEDGTRVTPSHEYLRPDGSFMPIGDILARDGLFVGAAGDVKHVTGRLIRATDAGSDAEWIEPEPYLSGNVCVKPEPVFGWRTYNFTVEGLHTYVAGGLRVHNDCITDTEHLVGVRFLDASHIEYDVVDRVTGIESKIVERAEFDGDVIAVERTTYFPEDNTSYLTTSWDTFEADGTPVGPGEVTAVWRNQQVFDGQVNFADGPAIWRQQGLVGGYDQATLEWVNSDQSPLLQLDIISSPSAAETFSTLRDYSNFTVGSGAFNEITITGGFSGFVNGGVVTTSGDVLARGARTENGSYVRLAFDIDDDGDFNEDGSIDTADILAAYGTDDPDLIFGADGVDGLQGGVGDDVLETVIVRPKLVLDRVTGELVSPGTLAGSEVGAIFGSALSQAIPTDNIVESVAAASVLAAVGRTIGAALGNSLDTGISFTAAANAALGQFGANLQNAFQQQALGALSGFLMGELAESLGFNSAAFGDQLLRSTAGSITQTVLANVATNPASPFAGLTAAAGVNFGVGIASFIGGYVARQIVEPENLGGSIGGTIGGGIGALLGAGVAGTTSGGVFVAGTLGSIGTSVLHSIGLSSLIMSSASLALALPIVGVGALIGAALGTIIGNAFEALGDDHGYGLSKSRLEIGSDRFAIIEQASDDMDFGTPAFAQGTAANELLNQILDAIGGDVVTSEVVSLHIHVQNIDRGHNSVRDDWIAVYERDLNYYTNAQWVNTWTERQRVDLAVVSALDEIKIAGGSLYMKRALANTQATSVAALAGDLKIAEDYARYLANKDIIDAMIQLASNDNRALTEARLIAA